MIDLPEVGVAAVRDPLVVTLDANDIASADGAVSESPATTFKDPAFGVDTHFYSSAFSLTVPVKLSSSTLRSPARAR